MARSSSPAAERERLKVELDRVEDLLSETRAERDSVSFRLSAVSERLDQELRDKMAGGGGSETASRRELEGLRRRWAVEQTDSSRKLRSSRESQRRQTVLIERLQLKVLEYKNRCEEIESDKKDVSRSLFRRSDDQTVRNLENALIRLEEEQQRSSSLSEVNALLREQLTEANASSADLSCDLRRLTLEWTRAREGLEAREAEWRSEEERLSGLLGAERSRLMDLWTKTVRIRGDLAQTRSLSQRAIEGFRVEFGRVAVHVAASCRAMDGRFRNLELERCREAERMDRRWDGEVERHREEERRRGVEMETSHSRILFLSEKLTALERETKDKEDTILELERKATKLTKSEENKTKEIESLKESLKNRTEELEDLSRDAVLWTERTRKGERERENLEEDLERVRSERGEIEHSRNTLQSLSDVLRSEKENQDIQIKSLTDRLREADGQNVELERERNAERDGRERGEKMAVELEERISAFQSESLSLRESLSSVSAERDVERERRERFEGEVERVGAEVESLRRWREGAKESEEDLRRNLLKMSQFNQILAEHKNELHRELFEKDEAVGRWRERVRELEEECRSSAEQLRHREEREREREREAEGEREQLEREKMKAQTEIRRWERERNEIKEKLSQSLSLSVSLSEQLNECREEVREKEQKVISVSLERENERKEVAEAIARLTEAERERESLSQLTGTLRATILSLQDGLVDGKKEISRLQRENESNLGTKREELGSVRKQLEEAMARWDREKEAMKREMEERETEFTERLKETLRQVEEEKTQQQTSERLSVWESVSGEKLSGDLSRKDLLSRIGSWEKISAEEKRGRQDRISSLESDLEDLRRETEEKRATSARDRLALRSEMDRTREELERGITDRQTEVVALEREALSLRQELSHTRERLNEAEKVGLTERTQREREKETLREEVKKLETEVTRLRRAGREAEERGGAEAEGLRAKVSGLEASQQRERKEIQILHKRLKEAEMEVNECSSRATSLQNSRESEAREQTEELDRLRRKLLEAERESAAAQSQLDATDRQLREREGENREREESFSHRLAEMEGRLEVSLSSHDSLRLRLVSSESRLTDAQTRARRFLSGLVHSLGGALEFSLESETDLIGDGVMVKINERLNEIREESEEREREKVFAQSTVTLLRKELRERGNETEESKRECDTARERAAEIKEECGELRRVLSRLRAEVEGDRTSRAEGERERERQNERISALERELGQSRARAALAGEQLHSTTQTLDIVKRENGKLLREIELRHRELRRDSEKEARLLREQAERGKETAREMEREKSLYQERVGSLQRAVAVLETEKRGNETEIERRERDRQTLRAALDKAQRECHKLETDTKELERETETLKETLTTQETEIQTLHGALDEARARAAELEGEGGARGALEADLDRLRLSRRHLEVTLEARERAHRQRVRGLEEQVAVLKGQIMVDRKHRREYLSLSSRTSRQLTALRCNLTESLKAVVSDPDLQGLESETQRLDFSVSQSLSLPPSRTPSIP